MAHDVFVSYSSDDKPIADAVAAGLEHKGIRCWLAPRDMTPGASWRDAIVAAIDASRIMIVILSQNSNRSLQVIREVERAVHSGVVIIPFRIDNTDPTGAMAYFLSTERWLDALTPPLEKHIDRLGSTIHPFLSEGDRSVVEERFEEAEPRWTGLLGRLFNRQRDRRDHGDQSGQPRQHPVSSEPSPAARGTALMPTTSIDNVHFLVMSPPIVSPGTSFLVDVSAYLEEQRSTVIRRLLAASGDADIRIKSKGPVEIARGIMLSVRLEVQELTVEDPEDYILWDGNIGSASFSVIVPKDLGPGQRRGLVRIYANGVQVARFYFQVDVGDRYLERQPLALMEERLKKAFASYSSADREAVLARVQGMHKVAPHLEVFIDVMSLRSGQDWELELVRRILASDVFYLFWSENARQSQWVEKEWRCALTSRGLDFIDPVPLVPAVVAPPPPELAPLHFDDRHLAFMRWQASGGS